MSCSYIQSLLAIGIPDSTLIDVIFLDSSETTILSIVNMLSKRFFQLESILVVLLG